GFHRHRTDPLRIEPLPQPLQFAGEGAEDFGRVAGNGDMEFFAADIDGGRLGVQHGQSFHDITGNELNQLSVAGCPVVFRRTSLPSGNTTEVASPNNARADDRNQSLPPAVPKNGTRQRGMRPRCARRLTTDAAYSTRFMGSKREIPFGRILSPKGGRGSWGNCKAVATATDAP